MAVQLVQAISSAPTTTQLTNNELNNLDNAATMTALMRRFQGFTRREVE